MRQEQSFGIIPLSKKDGEWKIFLVQHRHSRHWSFPKGHAEPGESSQEAAQRELKEETHLEVRRFLQEKPLEEQYRFLLKNQCVSKRVLYFIAEVEGEVILQEKEISGGGWFLLSEALKRITHSEGKDLLREAIKCLGA